MKKLIFIAVIPLLLMHCGISYNICSPYAMMSETTEINSVRFGAAGVGTSTATLIISGTDPGTTMAEVEQWNGTAWTEIADLNTARAGYLAASGITTAALAFGGGGANAPANFAQTESWDGTSWTEGNDLNTGSIASVEGI